MPDARGPPIALRTAGVIGHPVAHSLSPAIFAFLGERARAAGVRDDFRYDARDVAPADLAGFINRLRASSTDVGVNVTIPHKEAVRDHLDELSAEARAVGAVNVIRRAGPRLEGHNTDVAGVRLSLQEQGWHGAGQSVLVLGAGGAARAAAYAVASLGAREVRIWNRNEARAKALVADFAARFGGVAFSFVSTSQLKSGGPCSLVIQATPIGMAGVGAATALPALAALPRIESALAFDLVYVPERTPFLIEAEALGMRTLSGLAMLVHQALGTWELWLGQRLGPAVAVELQAHLRRLLADRAATANEQSIALAGFMGVGKSTIARLLAERLGWEMVDTDELIERRTGRSVVEIFAQSGEPRFRELEREIIAELAGRRRLVLALGGGALMHAPTVAILREHTRLVYLAASLETIEARVAPHAAQRPLLAGLAANERRLRLRALFEQRAGGYAQAEYQVDSDGIDAPELSERVATRLGYATTVGNDASGESTKKSARAAT